MRQCAAWYFAMMSELIRPRSETAMPWSLAQARIAARSWRTAAVRGARRDPPAFRAALM
jgi:hypothetical protein